jgi:predicted transcriptional regulator
MTRTGGRAQIGTTVQSVRLTDAMLARVDEVAAAHGITRSRAIRALVACGLTADPLKLAAAIHQPAPAEEDQ